MSEEDDRYTVFVPSTDGYSDLWQPLLHYMEQFWSWRHSTVMLGSNSKSGQLAGAVVCAVGDSEHWGEHVLKLLDLVPTETVLLMMPDFFLLKPVERPLFEKYLDLFEREQLKCLTLSPRSIHTRSQSIYSGCKTVDLTGAYSITLEMSLWNVAALRDVLESEDTPWSFERSARITAEDPRKWCCTTESVFDYVPTGALIRGSWTRRSQKLLTHDGLQNMLGERAILTRRASVLYGLRTLGFRSVSLVWPKLIRRYNLYLVRARRVS
jgi:hypothetical protein